MIRNAKRVVLLFLLAFVSGCSVGPDYRRPSIAVPAGFKEGQPWRAAQPRDLEMPGDWWRVFGDPVLNDLETRVLLSNQSLVQAEAQYRQALALVQGARASFFPRATLTPAATRTRPAAAGSPAGANTTNQFLLPLDVGWEIDLWGRLRRQLEADAAGAQASAADLRALVLSSQAALAQDYLLLRITDAQKQLLDETVAVYQRALELTRNRYNAGVAARADVVQAQTQLTSARAQAIDLGVQRSQLEHAIALLIGKAPADFSLAATTGLPSLPPIPVGVPSDLLERRPDIASAERRVAAANAQIGVATAACFPSLTLSASAGYQSAFLAELLRSPSFFWALGPAALAQTLFDGGAITAQVEQAKAAYEATVAAYRQTVLTGFQEVEDALSSLDILAEEARVQAEAVATARESVTLTTNQYKAGIVSYLNVIVVQTAALTSERTALTLSGQRLTAAVSLIKALGGGWEAAELHKPAAPPRGKD